MEVVILIVIMVVVGLIIGWVAGFLWKGKRPIGVRGDYLAAVITAVAVGLVDWFVVPAMGFSQGLKYLSVALEPALGALLVLWIIRQARK
jgi:uncharacterized membrane protein YeaQ/YmgE (transglycosylase-associated protein family)